MLAFHTYNNNHSIDDIKEFKMKSYYDKREGDAKKGPPTHPTLTDMIAGGSNKIVHSIISKVVLSEALPS